MLLGDNTVLASHTYSPGAWTGDMAFTPVSFQYIGNGGSDVRLRVGPEILNLGRFQSVGHNSHHYIVALMRMIKPYLSVAN